MGAAQARSRGGTILGSKLRREMFQFRSNINLEFRLVKGYEQAKRGLPRTGCSGTRR